MVPACGEVCGQSKRVQSGGTTKTKAFPNVVQKPLLSRNDGKIVQSNAAQNKKTYKSKGWCFEKGEASFDLKIKVLARPDL